MIIPQIPKNNCKAEAAASPEATASPTEATPAPGKRLLERGNSRDFVGMLGGEVMGGTCGIAKEWFAVNPAWTC